MSRTFLVLILIFSITIVCYAQSDAEGFYNNWNVPIHRSWVEMSSPETKEVWNNHHFKNLHGDVKSIEQTIFKVVMNTEGEVRKRIKATQPYISTSGRTEFNKLGKRILWEKEKGLNQPREKRIWIYNEKGLLIEQGETKYAGKVIFTYDSLDRLIEKFEYSQWQPNDYRNTYVYTDNYISEEIAYKVPDGFWYKEVTSRDSTMFYTKTTNAGLVEYRTDTKGNIIWKYRHADLCTGVYTYNEYNWLTSDSIFNYAGVLKSAFVDLYDKKHRLIEQRSYSLSAPPIDFRKEYVRNAIGDVIRFDVYSSSKSIAEAIPTASEEYSYLYDEQANWIEKEVYKNGKLMYIVCREFEYY